MSIKDEHLKITLCKYCGYAADSCICHPVRLILRKSQSDCEGKFVGYVYGVTIVRVPITPELEAKLFDTFGNPEIVGGEWLSAT